MHLPADESIEAGLAYQLTTRYAPYANWESFIDIGLVANHESEKWWSSPEEMRARRNKGSLPLAGLHLAIDPGHIGGIWAESESRSFRISEDDYWVREGELVLEVAKEAEIQLVQLGAKVTFCLLYTSPSPRDRTRSRMPSSA